MWHMLKMTSRGHGYAPWCACCFSVCFILSALHLFICWIALILLHQWYQMQRTKVQRAHCRALLHLQDAILYCMLSIQRRCPSTGECFSSSWECNARTPPSLPFLIFSPSPPPPVESALIQLNFLPQDCLPGIPQLPIFLIFSPLAPPPVEESAVCSSSQPPPSPGSTTINHSTHCTKLHNCTTSHCTNAQLHKTTAHGTAETAHFTH